MPRPAREGGKPPSGLLPGRGGASRRAGPSRRVALLERTPAVLRALLAGLPEEWTHRNEGPGTWSPFDVVGHLIDGEETDWMVRARIVLSSGPELGPVTLDRSSPPGSPTTSTTWRRSRG